MPLDHDRVKAAANLKKHGVSFADAEGALLGPMALTIEHVGAVDEPRFVTVGLGSAGDLLVGAGDAQCQPITASGRSVAAAIAAERARHLSDENLLGLLVRGGGLDDEHGRDSAAVGCDRQRLQSVPPAPSVSAVTAAESAPVISVATAPSARRSGYSPLRSFARTRGNARIPARRDMWPGT